MTESGPRQTFARKMLFRDGSARYAIFQRCAERTFFGRTLASTRFLMEWPDGRLCWGPWERDKPGFWSGFSLPSFYPGKMMYFDDRDKAFHAAQFLESEVGINDDVS